MIMLVSLAQTKRRLQIDADITEVDEDLTLLIKGASRAVLNYLKKPDAYQDSNGDVVFDSNGDPVGVPEEVQLATLTLIGIMYRDPDGVEMEKWQHGYLPFPVTSFLYPLRDPTIA